MEIGTAELVALVESTLSLGMVVVIWRMFMSDRKNISDTHQADIQSLNAILERHTAELDRMDRRLRECEDARENLLCRIAVLEGRKQDG